VRPDAAGADVGHSPLQGGRIAATDRHVRPLGGAVDGRCSPLGAPAPAAAAAGPLTVGAHSCAPLRLGGDAGPAPDVAKMDNLSFH